MPNYSGDHNNNDFYVREDNTDDHYVYMNDGDDTVETGSGNDYIDGGRGQDEMKAGAGDDSLFIDGEDTLVDGGEGYDVASVGWNVADIIFADAHFANIEEIDLGSGNEWDASTLIGDSFFGIHGLTGEQVANATDADNELVIKGDSSDSVDLDEASFGVSSPYIEGYDLFGNGESYDIYQAENGAMLAIDSDIEII